VFVCAAFIPADGDVLSRAHVFQTTCIDAAQMPGWGIYGVPARFLLLLRSGGFAAIFGLEFVATAVTMGKVAGSSNAALRSCQTKFWLEAKWVSFSVASLDGETHFVISTHRHEVYTSA